MKKERKSKIAVLIPCYNESFTIQKVVRDYKEVLPEADIYVYDNNSTDGSGELARQAGAFVCQEFRQGKGNVIRSMFREIEAECYLMVDGDDTYPAESARKMTEEVLENGMDMVVGDRLSSTYFSENKRRFHNVGNRLVRGLINRLFQSEIHDVMSGYRAFSYLFVKSYPVLSRGFEIETEMTIHALDKNFKIRELPVKFRDRPEGSVSKLNTVSDGARVLSTILILFRDYRPFAFFTAFMLLCEIVAAVLFFPILMEYIATGLVPKFPTLLVACVIGLLGMLMWVCGIILSVIAKKHRQLFELYLHLIKQKRSCVKI